MFAQNIPKYNPEWEHSSNGRVTSYLATLVCRYMHELQQKDKKVILSAKALETIYHTASSSIGKLILGKQYLGGYALEQVQDKVEAEGKELPFRKRRNYHKDHRASQGRAVVRWNIKKGMQDKMSKHQESSQKSRFGVSNSTFSKGNFKEVWYFGKRILRKLSKIAEKLQKLR